jgi:arylsulfatase A-like enzyme
MWFSYPGYNEIFTGRPDDARILSNAKLPNPNTNVLEFIHKQRGFRNKVVAYTSWDVFPAILNEKRSKILVNSGFENQEGTDLTGVQEVMNRIQQQQPKYWGEAERFDFFTWAHAMEHVRTSHPRVTYIGLGDTDEFAHEGHYDLYLDAARQADQWLAELWQFIQKDKKYRDKTTLFITVDHGRGDKVKKQWRDHNSKVEGADAIWFAAIGPDTPSLGEVRQPGQIWQKQFAQTFARLLGLTFQCDHEVAPAIESVVKF